MRLAGKAGALALVAAFGLTLGATPASAATGVGIVEVSADGVNFAESYPGVIFDDIALLVPGDSQNETVYVRNAGTATGYLRITLQDVAYSDQHFGDALTVTTSTATSVGSAAAISSANPCQVTHEGTLIGPGEIVPVLTTLALGNLDGTDGQGATASLALRFTLTDTTPGTLPATDCSTAGTTVPVTPPGDGAPGATGSAPTDGSSAFIAVPNPGSSPAPATSEIASGGESSGFLRALASTFTLDPNTWRLYQEYLVLILVLAAMIGAGLSWLVGRRKDSENA